MAKSNTELAATLANKRGVVSLADWGANLRRLIDARAAQYEAVLPKAFPVERFKQVAIQALLKNADQLAKCTTESILATLADIAQQGLDPSLPNEVALVAFRDKCVKITGYKGYSKLARRSPHVSQIDAEEVYANDNISFRKGSQQFLHHTFDPWSPRGELVGFYAVADMVDGRSIFTLMSVDEVEAHARRFIRAEHGPFGAIKRAGRKAENFVPYGLKTCLIRLCYRDLDLHADLARELEQEFESQQQVVVAPVTAATVAPADALEALDVPVSDTNGGTWPAITEEEIPNE